MKIRAIFATAIAAVIAIVALPTAAQAVAADLTTVATTIGGSTPTQMQQDDVIDVVTHGPIAQIGRSEHVLYTSWSTQSLQLQGSGAYDADTNPLGLTYPQDWALEYTTDGTNWSTSAPGDLATVIAVRAKGDIKSTGRGTFETTSAGVEVVNATEFGGTSEGDGYNVAFGDGFLLNSWHHLTQFNVECHLIDGSSCIDDVHTIAEYETSMAASLYLDKDTARVYSVVRETESGDIGVYCLDYSAVLTGNAVDCPTPFTSLADVASGGLTMEFRGAGVSLDGDQIFTLDVSHGTLLCFDISTNAACPNDNGVLIGTPGAQNDGELKGRVTAINDRVFFTINDTFGCYDRTTHDLCGDPNATVLALDDIPNRHPPVPMYNTSGTYLGVCDWASQQCLDNDGESFSMPTGFANYLTAHPANDGIGGLNAQQWGITGHKMYYPGPADFSGPYPGFSTTIICWDYSTDALCSGWDDSPAGIWLPYTANIDPDNPSCVWINQDKGWLPQITNYRGKIIPLNASTGEVGCALGDPVIELPYQSVVPRMSCDGTGRVTNWNDIALNLHGINPNDISISIYDDTDTLVTGWDSIDVDANGYLDLSTLTVAESSTTPSIQITGTNGVTLEELLAVTGTVNFDADEPELCFGLIAKTNCPDAEINIPGIPDVPAGIVEGSSITYPTNGGREVGSKQRVTIAGTNSGTLCASTAWSAFIPTLAETGFDAVPVALGGFAVLGLGFAAAVWGRRRRL